MESTHQQYSLYFPYKKTEHDFRKVQKKLTRKQQAQIKQSILGLKINPRPQGKIWKQLSEPQAVHEFRAKYRIRVGNYRVLYDIDEKRKRIILLKLRKKNKRTYKC